MRVKNICETCEGRCCRYFALEIDVPETARDFDDIRWYLAHEKIRIFVEEGEWYLEVMNPCRHLDKSNRCRIYASRPAICREHATDDCEGHEKLHFDREHEFNSEEELTRFAQQFLAEKKRKRGKKRKAKKDKQP